jgi:tetratricopeptide (TPR) repeat protein
VGEEKDHVHTIVTANWILGDIFCNLGNISRALQFYRAAQIREGYSINSLHGIENNIHLAHALIQSGRFIEARELNQITIKVTQKNKMGQFLVQSILVEVECDLLEGHLAEAEKNLSRVEDLLENRGLKLESLIANLAKAQLATVKGCHSVAVQLLEKTINDGQTLGATWITLEALQRLAHYQRIETNLKFNIDIESVYRDLILKLETHTQSDPINKDFKIAKETWDDKIRMP